MDSKGIKRQVAEGLLELGFERHKNFWLLRRASADQAICVVVLDKSKWGDSYQLYIKIFVNGVFGSPPELSRVHRANANILRGLPREYADYFDCEKNINAQDRKEGINAFLEKFLAPIVNKVRNVQGILELQSSKLLTINPSVEAELRKLV